MNTITLHSSWTDYELIDSGDREKLERFGPYTFIRPEPKALWKKSDTDKWVTADAIFHQSENKTGTWEKRSAIPESWHLKWNNLTFKIRPTLFKHMGIFPESSAHWEWLVNLISRANRPINVLNLFAYTGGCTLAALSAGASVTHVDASKSTVTWAHENALLSGLGDKPVRWIVDDAVTFVKREIKRGKKYDAIVIDPPKFGRAENGKVWKFEQDIPQLMASCKEILSDNPLFLILNTYTVEFSSVSLAYLLEDIIGEKGVLEHGEILIPSASSHPLPTSIIARWTSDSL